MTTRISAAGLNGIDRKLQAGERLDLADGIRLFQSPDLLATALPRYLNGRAATIYAGSNEIQRDLIARAVLG